MLTHSEQPRGMLPEICFPTRTARFPSPPRPGAAPAPACPGPAAVPGLAPGARASPRLPRGATGTPGPRRGSPAPHGHAFLLPPSPPPPRIAPAALTCTTPVPSRSSCRRSGARCPRPARRGAPGWPPAAPASPPSSPR